jgi:membrane protease YdiL (CAAX protease family)
MDTILIQRFELLGLAVMMAWLTSLVAWKLDFFHSEFPYFKPPPSVQLENVCAIFVLFLAIQLLFVPLLAWAFFSFRAGHLIYDPSSLKISSLEQGWLNLLAIFVTFTGLLLFFLWQSPAKKRLILWGGKPGGWLRASKDFKVGAATWLVSYPLVLVLSQIIGIFAYYIGPPTPVDQVAVKHLKMTMGSPLLFYCTAIVIVIIVPITEELLFRGFLQRWFVTIFNRFWGIVLTACFFALFHFSFSQSWENIELLLSLFILACFLGYLYERQGSLWAPIGLHMVFNSISVFFIIFEGVSKS